MSIKYAKKMEDAIDWLSMLTYNICGAQCAYRAMDKEYLASLEYPELVRDNNGSRLLEGDAYIIITCPNGYKYYVNVTGDSILTACAETLNFAKNKF